MSDVERTCLLGEGSQKLPKSAPTFSDGSVFDVQKEGYSEPMEKDIRNWLKGIRDSGYVPDPSYVRSELCKFGI